MLRLLRSGQAKRSVIATKTRRRPNVDVGQARTQGITHGSKVVAGRDMQRDETRLRALHAKKPMGVDVIGEISGDPRNDANLRSRPRNTATARDLRGLQCAVKTEGPCICGIDHQCGIAQPLAQPPRLQRREDGRDIRFDADQHDQRFITIGTLYRRPARNAAPGVAHSIDAEGQKRISLGDGRNVVERRRPFADDPQIGIHRIDDPRRREREAVKQLPAPPSER